MAKNVRVNVEYLTRVEGHGNIVVNVTDGRLEECRLDIVEAPRFFEGLLRGRSIFEAQHITSRICGICAVGHTLASIQAAEDAIGFVPSVQTVLLRKVMLHLEILDSHLLHIYLLVAPDLLGVDSFLPLIDTHNQVVRRGAADEEDGQRHLYSASRAACASDYDHSGRIHQAADSCTA